jgi:hypothetical protein
LALHNHKVLRVVCSGHFLRFLAPILRRLPFMDQAFLAQLIQK